MSIEEEVRRALQPVVRAFENAATLLIRQTNQLAVSPQKTPPAVPGSSVSDPVALELRNLTNRLANMFGETLVEDIPLLMGKSNPTLILPFVKEVAKLTEETETRSITYASYISTVMMAFPSGCHHLVECVLWVEGRGGKRNIVPSLEDFSILLDDHTAVFHPNFAVDRGNKLVVQWKNHDSGNDHNVPVYVTLVPKG